MTIAHQHTPATQLLKPVSTRFLSRSRKLGLALIMQLAATVTFVVGNAHAQGMLSIDALGQTYSAAKTVPTSLSHLTFYRLASDSGAKAISVYIDGAYHTSLIKNGYSEACLKPGTAAIGLRRVEDATDTRNPTNVTPVSLKNGQQQFLRVIDQASEQPTIQVVPATQALAELAQNRQQIHTLSRAPSVFPCEDAPVVVTVTPVAAPAPPQVISLASDTLFAFGKSGLDDMLLVGRTELDQVVSRVKTEYASIDNIRVIGHSDPIGRPVDKQRISSQRAQTVNDYISSHGLQSARILSVGRADNELAVTNCGNRPTPNNIQCNAPNRRVTIEITGTRR